MARKKKKTRNRPPAPNASPSAAAVDRPVATGAAGSASTKRPPGLPEKSPPPVAGDDEPILLSPTEVCRLLAVSRSTLDRLAKAGKIPGRVKLGSQVRYHRQLLERWLLDQVEDQP